MCAHIVLAEDDEHQAELVRRYLEREQHTVVVVSDGGLVLEEVRRHPPDLLVLDVMLPTLSGLDICRVLRAESALPVLMLTARSTEDDLLHGLDIGADDYVTKPFSPRELMARVRALLRRGQVAAPAEEVLRVGAVTVHPDRHEVTCEGRPVECTPGEFRLLRTLAAQPERVFTRKQLLEHMHGYGDFVTMRTIDVHVMNLRRKLEHDSRSPTRLVTVYGVGYKLSDDTERTVGAP
ncbi:DNA-binding response OmpR family regulator [Crossiella equi]|uniref:DNA-binding response OmpR family regulator n=1 Tax=Crossiella equi TaxID=130796 RepID=A0ABS5AN17_9PSEU|nr:response regulator transcription factor [Crossiella equi]MBP2477967.1 DNA-binding response OmpR family regulator [Crossiella equi]